MRDAINHIVFGWYPYLCLTVFLLGSLLRFDREQYTWKTGSSQLLRRRQLMWGSNLFHVGILVIFFGHLVGLLTPIWVFDVVGISHGFKQMMAIVVGGIAGVFCLIGIALADASPPVRSRASAPPRRFGDIAILLLLFAQLLLGLATIPVSHGPSRRPRDGEVHGLGAGHPACCSADACDAGRGRAPDLQGAPLPRHDASSWCSRSRAWCTCGARRSGISAGAATRSCARAAGRTPAPRPAAPSSRRSDENGLLAQERPGARRPRGRRRQRHRHPARCHLAGGAEPSGSDADRGLDRRRARSRCGSFCCRRQGPAASRPIRSPTRTAGARPTRKP